MPGSEIEPGHDDVRRGHGHHQTASISRDCATSGIDNRLVIRDAEFWRLRDLIRQHTGIALTEHKRALICSRLAKRLRHHGLKRYQDYYDLLTQSVAGEQELVAMINAITTNKTQFFREPHQFRFLSDRVLLPLRQQSTRPRPLLLWSAGTASGEEAYSLAMTVLEVCPDWGDGDVRILATDIDTDVLRCAESGVYTLGQADPVPDALLHRYFLQGRGPRQGYVMVKPSPRSLIRFRRLNLMDASWPMRGPFDAILCRNVLIYFDKVTQQQLIARFSGMLRQGGFLMLGHSEGLHGFDSGFRSVGNNIYAYEGG